MKKVFAPGCALILYKPDLVEKINQLLNDNVEYMDRFDICCRNKAEFDMPTQIVNICSGCNKRYRKDYPNVETISIWEIIAESDFLKFPDYHGIKMSIHDPCDFRTEPKIHAAVRKILKKMNIEIVEAEKSKNKSVCCGDSSWGVLPTSKVKEKMQERASQMPEDNVLVYCVSCIKSMHIGGKTPFYLVDLVFGEETIIGTYEPDDWHRELEEFIKTH
ncbi:MAG: (Fe-S)-binding protein [bacterium]